MKIPIPNDWDENSWFCIQVQWPNSPQYVGILAGLLTQMTRGRLWDENTGQITHAQDIAWQVVDKNMPFNPCAETEKPSEPDKQIVYAMASSEEHEIMSLCGYNPKAFKVENGVLYVKDFCGDWVAIGSVSATSEGGPDDIWTDVDPQPDYYACGKVSLLIDQFVALSDAVWNNYTDPLTMYSGCANAVSSAVNLSKTRVLQWIAQILLLEPLFEKTDFNDEDAVQQAKCMAVGSVENTAVGTDDEVEAVVNAMANAFSALKGPLTEWHWYAYWDFIRDTFGDYDCRKLMNIGAPQVADCSCPDYDPTENWPEETDWYVVLDFRGQQPLYTTLGSGNGITIITQRGAELEADTVGSDKVEVTWSPPIDTGIVTHMRLEMLINPTWLASGPWMGNGLFTPDEMYLQSEIVDDGGGEYHWQSVTVNHAIGSWYTVAEANANDGLDPMMPVFKRIVLAGTGPNPFG